MAGGIVIQLPFPPASLSGHNTGHWRKKSPVVAQHRKWATLATLAVRVRLSRWPLLDERDIHLNVTFHPPNKRGDRCNYPNRMKPYFDGIADALCVNDRRFLPTYTFGEPTKGGMVLVEIGA